MTYDTRTATRTRRRRGGSPLLRVSAAILLSVFLAACFNPVDPNASAGPGDETPTNPAPTNPAPEPPVDDGPSAAEQTLAAMQGTWMASRQIDFYGSTLTSTHELTVTDTSVALSETIRDADGVPLHAFTVTGTVTPEASAAMFAFVEGTQAADNGDGGFDVETSVALATSELEEIGAELGGTRPLTFDGTTLTVETGSSAQIVFEKQ